MTALRAVASLGTKWPQGYSKYAISTVFRESCVYFSRKQGTAIRDFSLLATQPANTPADCSKPTARDRLLKTDCSKPTAQAKSRLVPPASRRETRAETRSRKQSDKRECQQAPQKKHKETAIQIPDCFSAWRYLSDAGAACHFFYFVSRR